MERSTKFTIGACIYTLFFGFMVFKFQDGSLPLNAVTLHEKLVRTTHDFKVLSAVNHLLFILVILGGLFREKMRGPLFVLFMIYLSGSVFISAFKHNIFINYIYFPALGGLLVYAAKKQKIRFDYKALSLQDKIIGGVALLAGFWYLALVESPVWVNALIYSPVGVVNCPTVLAMCGFLILNSEYGNRSHLLELFVVCGALFFGGLGLLTMNVYYDAILVSAALYMTWRLWKEAYKRPL